MVETVVEPILFYGAGIWGYRKFPVIEAVLNKAKRFFLGVSKNAPNAAVGGDMGWSSADTKQKLEVVRLWCRLRHFDDNRVVRKSQFSSIYHAKSWERQVIKLFDKLGISDSLLVDKPCKTTCMNLAVGRLSEMHIMSWNSSLVSDGRDVNNGNKLRTYRTYKTEYKTEPYVLLNMSRDQRRVLSKFRCCNLPLAIETGRFTKPKTPLTDRLCIYCDSHLVEDEMHLLIDCEFYSDIRFDLLNSAQRIDPNFYTLDSVSKLNFLMNCNNLQFNVANCLLAMLKRRRLAA